jgi:hypothetical protein
MAQSLKEKRTAAIARCESSKFEDSKRFRTDSSEESRKAWLKWKEEHLDYLKSLR